MLLNYICVYMCMYVLMVNILFYFYFFFLHFSQKLPRSVAFELLVTLRRARPAMYAICFVASSVSSAAFLGVLARPLILALFKLFCFLFYCSNVKCE